MHTPSHMVVKELILVLVVVICFTKMELEDMTDLVFVLPMHCGLVRIILNVGMVSAIFEAWFLVWSKK